jgi:hypothetical protein
MNDCYDISILPDYNDDCLLNTIIIAILYSQYSRNLLLNLSINWKSDIYLNIIKNIISSYYKNEKSANIYYQSLISAKTLFEIIVGKKLKHSRDNLQWNELNILNFYNFLGVNCQDLIYFNDGRKERYLLNYIGKKKPSFDKPPEVIVLFHQNLHSLPNKLLNGLKGIKRSNVKQYLIGDQYVGTIASYDNEIEFMDNTYVLSSCITNDNEDSYKHHSIAGIICNDKKMVFNHYNKIKNNKCSLIPYDWDLKKNEDFCFNPKDCNLDLSITKKITDLCFNFGIGDRVLIYVQKNKSDVSSLNIQKLELTEFKPEPILTNFQEEIKKIKDKSLICLYCELEHILGTKIDIKEIYRGNPYGTRDDIEKTILEHYLSKLSIDGSQESLNEQHEKQTEVSGGTKKYTKKELLSLIIKKLNKTNKNKLMSIYNQLNN